MKSLLHILHLEDDPNDAALVKSVMASEGIACEIICVQDHDHFVAALEQGGIDLILSDYSLPAFSGLSAAEIVRSRWPSIPLILVSGSLAEERAIDSFKSGATDYVLKKRLAGLAPAVRRAMQEVEDKMQRRSLEAQFIEAQKMEIIGQLAGGVAHDFNNLLAIIMGYSDMLLADLPADDRLRKYASEIRHASERAAGLTRQLLVFSRKQTIQPVVMDINEVVDDLELMLRRLVDENVEISFILEKPLGNIEADPGYIGQVLMNLVVNGRDAMPDGGKLVISTANTTLLKADLCHDEGALPGEYVMLGVKDAGSGMSEEVKKRLFEAFFTTKPLGKGTGLGLSTSRTIVRQCGGLIKVDSDLGKGTAFRVYFPATTKQIVGTICLSDETFMPRGTETILIVEDESSVMELAKVVLEAQGYTALSAANGQEALLVAQQHREPPISLVITDVIMPRMGGKIMAQWLKVTHPDLKVLFTSGYNDDSIAHHGVLEPGIDFLAKPYTPAILVRTVRSLLDNVPLVDPGKVLPLAIPTIT